MKRPLRLVSAIFCLGLASMNTARADDDATADVAAACKATADAPTCRITAIRTVVAGNKVEKMRLEIVRPDLLRALIEGKDAPKIEIVTDGKKTLMRRGDGKFTSTPAAGEQIKTMCARLTLAEVEYTGVEWVGHDHLDDKGAVVFRVVKKQGDREGENTLWVSDHGQLLLKVEENVSEGGKPVQHTVITYDYDPALTITMPAE